VVGARYDSVPGSPGADDNATGVAALLALARRFAHTAPARTFRFVLFSDAAGRAYFEASGAFHHAQVLHQDPTYFAATSARFNEGMQAEFARGKVALMLELSGLGVYSLRSGSQAYPEGMPRVREAGDFVELTAYPEASALASEFAERFRSTCAVPVVTSLLLDHAAALPTSTHRAFLDYGVPALMLSDTLQRRSPDVGSPRDQLEGIDFDRLARVTLGIEAALQRLASH
jgi:Zn-dependent M28 family amino/carboxypeptidase